VPGIEPDCGATLIDKDAAGMAQDELPASARPFEEGEPSFVIEHDQVDQSVAVRGR
jgi:hypothetical protein